MKKQLFVLGLMMVLGGNLVVAEEMAAPAAEEMAVPVVMANNKICPISGRELNLNDANDFTTLEVEGVALNICPMAKAAYESDSAQYAEKIGMAVAQAKAPVVIEAPAAEVAAPVAAY